MAPLLASPAGPAPGAVVLWYSHHLAVSRDGSIGARVRLAAGEQLAVALHWSGNSRILYRADPMHLVDHAAQAWRRSAERLCYEGPQTGTGAPLRTDLELLDHAVTGAIMAAATSSLPEQIGGVRNWDHRHTLGARCASSTYALRHFGMQSEFDASPGP